jgi:uncharacterized protein
MIILGYIGALLMGIVLGLIGGGGSILTVPILVFVMGYGPLTATGLSLFIVGSTSAVGAWGHQRLGNVRWDAAAVFGGSSLVSVFCTRCWLLPALPDPLFHFGATPVGKDTAIIGLFASVMLVVAWSMIGKPPEITIRRKADGSFRYPPLLIAGLAVGLLTGLLGAGGGFVIIPALVLLAGLPMRQAVGTSLVIIAINAWIGFLGDPHVHVAEHAALLLPFTGLAIVGILVGTHLSKRISNARLRPAFGWSVLAMGVYILARQLG